MSGFSYSTRVSFFTSTRTFFGLDSNFKISNRVCSHDSCLVFFRSSTYILKISTHAFYCIRCISQVSTCVFCFQHVFSTIGIIFSATERHTWISSSLGNFLNCLGNNIYQISSSQTQSNKFGGSENKCLPLFSPALLIQSM